MPRCMHLADRVSLGERDGPRYMLGYEQSATPTFIAAQAPHFQPMMFLTMQYEHTMCVSPPFVSLWVPDRQRIRVSCKAGRRW